MKEYQTDPQFIIDQVHQTDPQTTSTVKDPLFFAAFTRTLRKELENAQSLDKSMLNNEDQIDHSRVLIEVTHDPSKCTPHSDYPCHHCLCCESHLPSESHLNGSLSQLDSSPLKSFYYSF